MYFGYLFSDGLTMSSYMHFHSLYSPFRTIITIICLVVTMWINIAIDLTTTRSSGVGYVSHLSWLFTIIECFHHTSIWTTFRQNKVVIEYAILGSLRTILITNYFRSIILKILHESGLGVIHLILRWLLLLLVWVVESWCSSIRSGAETTLIHLILFVHEYYTVILLMAISSFKASIDGTSNWSSSIWELTSGLFVWLV